jgi:hypothetical protein
MTEQELRRLHRQAQEDFKQYPGVEGVGLGVKERGGQPTDEIAIRIYVSEKMPLAQLRLRDRLPSFYQGVRTDVLASGRALPATSACEDRSKHSPLVGGITISNGRRGDRGFALGTLGFFATINGIEGPNNIALVTNHHVLKANGGRVGDDVFHPDFNKTLPNNVIGKTLRLPEIDNAHFAYPGGGAADDYWIDCAAAQLNICISSWCHTNCGVSFANEIFGLGVNGFNSIADIARAEQHGVVYKVGRESGRTKGRIIRVDETIPVPPGMGLPTPRNVIEIEPLEPNCNGAMRFSDEGDSGAPIINEQGNLVGLLYSAATNPNNALACHIHPVLDALGLTAITRATPVHDNAAAVGMSADMMAIVDGRPNQTPWLRERFLACPEGQRIAALVEEHRHEVVHLVNHCRPVTVAWHRSRGPVFLNRAINNARDPEELIPSEIDGITRRALLSRMGEVLYEHGSPALRAMIERHREQALDYAATPFDSLHDLVDRLDERQPV